MPTLITGRRLDSRGQPIDGTGFTYDTDGPLAELLARRTSPLVSQPITGEWVFGLVTRAETGGAYERGAGVFPPGNAGPPEHIHPTYDEHFRIVQGEFVFRIGGQERGARAGDELVVSKGTPHTFRCVGSEHGALVVETRPAARTGAVICTLFGMAHEGLLTPQGQPKLLHAMVVGSEYADDTVFTTPPPAVALTIARLLAPLARALGYRAVEPKYFEEAFWRAHVEQPAPVGTTAAHEC
ncbi:MAG TPA: cupin domain-containing protein [Roseiflexaceae bacterium]|nr:cupin domain-containing protein [Roseiflexaceae bacterium]